MKLEPSANIKRHGQTDLETAAELSHMLIDLKSTVPHPVRVTPKKPGGNSLRTGSNSR